VPEKKVASVPAGNGESTTPDAMSEEQAKKRRNGQAGGLPQTELEKNIASVWQDVLELEHVGVDDNFFDLGARSLHVAQVHTRLRDILDKEISILDLFEYPTVNSLTQFVRGEQTEKTDSMSQQQRGQARRASRARRRRGAR
jgi:acyl carrier protein